MIVAGNVGLGINMISYADSFRISVSADNGILNA